MWMEHMGETDVQVWEEFFRPYTLCELAAPFVALDIQRGLSRRQVSVKYGLTEDQVRGIGRRSGVYE